MSKSSIAKKAKAHKYGQKIMNKLGINYTTLAPIDLKSMTERELIIELNNMNIYLYEQEEIFTKLALTGDIPPDKLKEIHLDIVSAIKYINFCLTVT